MFSHNNSPIIDLSRMFSYAVCYKKINNAMVKFVAFSQQPISQNLCVNIAHIRSKTFSQQPISQDLCVNIAHIRSKNLENIKFVKVSFQVFI